MHCAPARRSTKYFSFANILGILLEVVFNDFGRTFRGAIGVLAELFARAALAQEIPQAVELDVDLVEPAAVIAAQPRTFVEKGVLLGDERLNVLVDLLIVHFPTLPVKEVHATIRSATGVTGAHERDGARPACRSGEEQPR